MEAIASRLEAMFWKGLKCCNSERCRKRPKVKKPDRDVCLLFPKLWVLLGEATTQQLLGAVHHSRDQAAEVLTFCAAEYSKKLSILGKGKKKS